MNREESEVGEQSAGGAGSGAVEVPASSRSAQAHEALRTRVRMVIFESETPAGRRFDIFLMVAIVLSVGAVFLDSVPAVHAEAGSALRVAEWLFTLLFTAEYLVRIWCIEKPVLYVRSFYGVIDLLGVLPSYLSLLLMDAQSLTVIRILRVLRVFRVLRMVRWVGEASVLLEALMASRRKILVFLFAVLMLVVVFGSLLYVIEGPENGFVSIPTSMYWAIVTLTTVGYGDIVPHTTIGRALAACIMIMGYGIIAVPTGIVTVELNETMRRRANTRTCPHCSAEGHGQAASYCWRCGEELFKRRPEQVGAGDGAAAPPEAGG